MVQKDHHINTDSNSTYVSAMSQELRLTFSQIFTRKTQIFLKLFKPFKIFSKFVVVQLQLSLLSPHCSPYCVSPTPTVGPPIVCAHESKSIF